MSLPSTALVTCVYLLYATATAAQPPPAKQERQAPLVLDTLRPVPEVRVAAHVLSALLFPAPVAGARVERRERFARLDVGERAIYLEPAADLAPSERLVLHVNFADGREAGFHLVSHPSEVDARVDFTLPQRAPEACERDLANALARCEAQREEVEQLRARCAESIPAILALSGLFDGPVPKQVLTWKSNSTGLSTTEGQQYRLGRWTVLTVWVLNAGPEPWAPFQVRLQPGAPLAVQPRVVLPSGSAIAPRDRMKLAIELELPARSTPPAPGVRYSLTLCDRDEVRCLSVTGAELD